MFEPRTWQVEAREAVLGTDTRGKGAIVVAGTGSGKTLFALWLLSDVLAQGRRGLWVAAQNELIEQPLAALREHWPHFRAGVVQAGRNDVGAQMVFASKATLLRGDRLEQVLAGGDPALVVIDEAHESAAAGYQRILARIKQIKSRLLGLTATPERSDDERLSDDWEIVYQYPIVRAIEDRCIVPPYAAVDLVPALDLGRVKVSRGDYNIADLERELMRAHVVEHTVAALSRPHHAVRLPFRDHEMSFEVEDKGTLVHTVTVRQAEETAEALNKAGYIARVVWGEMPRADRERVLHAFREEKIDVLCSPAALAQGVDLPAAKVNVIARPTRSHRLFVQISGRVLRPWKEHEAGLLLDLCGATRVHSLIGAPVLVDGVDCPEADDGRHRYLIDGEGARCHQCGKTIRCYRNGGGHVFKRGTCVHCGSVQCTPSPSKDHSWIPWQGGRRVCIYCATEIPDPLAGLLKHQYAPKEPVAWTLLSDLPGTVYAVDLGRIGTMFNVKAGEGWRPYLFTRGTIHRLTPAPVPGEHARLLTDDVARQATMVRGAYGGHYSTGAKRISMVRATHIALNLKLWEGR